MIKHLLLTIITITLFGCSSDNTDIEGHYKYIDKDGETYNTLNIHEVKDGKFFFEMHSAVGQYVGYIEGTAELTSNNKAKLIETDYGPCELTFLIHNDSIITLDEINGTCNLGLGADYTGNYKKVSNNTQEMPFY